MITGVIQGVKAYLQSFGIIRRYKLWKYVLLSGVISLLLGIGILRLIWSYLDNIGG